jgi:hypothetical protein
VIAALRLEGLGAPAVFDGPIELAFAKPKALLRAARPRTFDQVCTLVAATLDLDAPTEGVNYVRHCGYRVL